MQEARPVRVSLERALAKTEADADAVLKAASVVTAGLKRFRAAAHVGNLRELRPAIDSAEVAIAGLSRRLADARSGWDFDEDVYFADRSYLEEVLETAKTMNVQVFEQDDRLYCYPALVKILANERAVQIDKARERRMRPTVLVNHLRDLQRRPPRFKPEAFLEALYSVYNDIHSKSGKDQVHRGEVVRLLEVYERLTRLPGMAKEYSRPEFARDVYLLDRSGTAMTRSGHKVSFPASTGTKSSRDTIRVITERGEEKLYYGIAFFAG